MLAKLIDRCYVDEGPQRVTASYLDERYVDIYELLYKSSTPMSKEFFTNRVTSFAGCLYTYLLNQGIDITKMYTLPEMSFTGLAHALVSLEIADKLTIVITMFQYQDCADPAMSLGIMDVLSRSTPQPEYRILPSWDWYLYATSTSSLAICIQRSIEKRQCTLCRYSDKDVKYCGKGMEMVPECTSFKSHENQ